MRLVSRVVLSSAAVPVAAALVVVLGTACGDGGGAQPVETPESLPAAAADFTLSDAGQGGVSIEVTWVTPEILALPQMERAGELDLSRYLAFYVRLNAESTDLSKYDLVRISVLRDLGGGEYQPEAWLLWDAADNYREGLLLFLKPELGPEGVELVVRGVGGVTERSFRWLALPGE